MASSTRAVVRAFKIQGLAIRADATKAVTRVVEGEEDAAGALQGIIRAIKERIERNELSNNVIDVDTISAVVADLSNTEEDLADESTQTQSAFERPRLHFDPFRKALVLESAASRKRRAHAPAEGKTYQRIMSALDKSNVREPRMLKERFLLVKQRVERHSLFRPPIIESSKREYMKLSPLDSLVGTSDVRWLIGMLTQPREGRYFLEDLVTRVPLDLSNARKTDGLYTEHCIVILEGRMTAGMFQVAVMGHPPLEERVDTLKAIGQHDIFGTGITPQQMERMRQMEALAEDAMFVIVSDVHLDRPKVMEKLEALFRGFQDFHPLPHFVLMGDFSSTPITHAPDSIPQAIERFDSLAKLIGGFPNLAEKAKFVFVPGPRDPGLGDTLPRAPLPKYFTGLLRETLKHASFSSNPCRIRFFTQEMVFFREDILRKMQRHSIFPPNDPEIDVTEHCARTLLHQGHLCPLPLAARPVHWELDDALGLYPLPHLAVVADHTEGYRWNMSGCCVLNPGSFYKDASFVVYSPATEEVDFSVVD